MRTVRVGPTLVAMLGAIVLAALAGGPPPAQAQGKKLTVGFIYAGPKDDCGYNYAHDRGRKAVEAALKDVEVLTAENIPEAAEVERVMEQMIQKGAKLLFTTSYGYLDPALNVGKRHPGVVLLHAGGFKHSATVGTYWDYIDKSGIYSSI